MGTPWSVSPSSWPFCCPPGCPTQDGRRLRVPLADWAGDLLPGLLHWQAQQQTSGVPDRPSVCRVSSGHHDILTMWTVCKVVGHSPGVLKSKSHSSIIWTQFIDPDK